ncbi:hypothetical protein VPIG_00092 [Vibrio phage PWH3a-P1]|uniref:hypothetical protein n=1 Tax=Vibrio phage PWH3a-P1 TaxID=754058 RepID=UPI0002C132F4|nr:hypothetical protein VPIG_00092 [Vibrio phage PWH3a-P1]AGH31950.1 hypothetical protein VPIG_00092 [Vibrio phage PWH3a-P1]
MQGKVPYEYLDHFFRQVNDFPKPHEITRKIEEVYEKLVKRKNDVYKEQWMDELKVYHNLSWWQKKTTQKPLRNWVAPSDAVEYFSSQSQCFRDYEKRLKQLQVVVDVMKLAVLCKNQVFVNSYEMRVLECVYKNIDNYIFLEDDVDQYLEKFL